MRLSSWTSPRRDRREHFLSHLSCPTCLVPSLLSPFHQVPQSGPNCHVLSFRPLYPVLADWSRQTCQADLSRLICQGCPVPHHSPCHVPYVMPQLYCHDCPAMVVPSQMSCTGCLVHLSCSGHPVYFFLSCLYHP